MVEKTKSGVIKQSVGKAEMPPSNKARKLEHSEKTVIEMTIEEMKEKGWVK
jgi:hypothetical protein